MKLTLKHSLQILVAVFAVCCLVIYFAQSNSLWHELAVNLAAGLIGTFLTVLLIDGVLNRQEALRLDRYAKIARARLKGPISRHVGVWADIYKACAPERPESVPERFDQLLLKPCMQHIIVLNGNAPSPAPSIVWAQYLHTEFTELKRQLEDVVDKFGVFLPVEEVEMICKCSDSPFLQSALMVYGTAAQFFGGQPFPVFLAKNGNNAGELTTFPGMGDYLVAVNTLILRIAASEGSITIGSSHWTDIVAPKFNSARLPGIPPC